MMYVPAGVPVGGGGAVTPPPPHPAITVAVRRTMAMGVTGAKRAERFLSRVRGIGMTNGSGKRDVSSINVRTSNSDERRTEMSARSQSMN